MATSTIITSIERAGADDLFWKASGTCNCREFTATSILYKGSPIFKIDDAGSIADGLWSRGERSAVARACLDRMLAETGQVVPTRKRKTAAKKKRSSFSRNGRRTPGVKYHHSGLPMNSSISALKRSH
ncbi:hypothetical protein CMI47_19520 [Candidatus Pacearchaeota archaeon]|nr:hypothetical protein [Candidatus Pacearchaeota archaeon]